MKDKVIMILIFSGLMVLSALLKANYFPEIHHTHRYYYNTFFFTCLILVVINTAGLVRWFMLKKKETDSGLPKDVSLNNRAHYRLTYVDNEGPMLRIEKDPLAPHKRIECRVLDISEAGISFRGNMFDLRDKLTGEVVFQNGDRSDIAGSVVRIEKDRTILNLCCAIPGSLIMKEQLRCIALKNPNEKKPAVSKDLLTLKKSSLKSLTPKGICKKERY